MNNPLEIPQRKLTNSQTINTAAFASLSAFPAVLAIALDKRAPGAIYWLMVAAGILALVTSVILGALALTRPAGGVSFFNLQAVICMLGFLLLAASMWWLGPSQESVLEKSALATAERVRGLEVELGALRGEIRDLRQHVETAERRLDSIPPCCRRR